MRLIKNNVVPICKNCIHFLPSEYSSLSRCNMFGEKNVIDGEIKNKFADSCRDDKNMCGLEGKHFVKESDIKIRLRNMKYNKLTYLTIFGLIYVTSLIHIYPK